jgi:hypothetical protein
MIDPVATRAPDDSNHSQRQRISGTSQGNAGDIGQWSVRAYVSKPPQEIAHLRESNEWVCFKIDSPIGWIPTLFTKKIFTGTIVTGWKHHRPALQPPTAEKVYTDVGAEIGELEDHLQIIRKSRSLLKSIDIYVGTTSNFDISASRIGVNIKYGLVPKQTLSRRW